MRYKVIVNPTAGRGKVKAQVNQLVQLLNDARVSYDLVVTERSGHGVELAANASDEGYEGVVAVGGDGTVHEVLNGLVQGQSSLPLGIIPLGTGNDLARTLNIPFNLANAVNLLTEGRKTSIDLGQDRDGFFSIILGIGFPADVMHYVNTVQNSIKGPLAIFVSVYQVINKLRPYKVKMRLENDDKTEVVEEEVMGVFILNTKFTGGGMQIIPKAVHDDGLLDIMVIKKMRKIDLLFTLPKVYRGKHLNHPKVCFYTAEKIEIESEERMIKTFDGNVYGETPLKTQVLPQRLAVIIP